MRDCNIRTSTAAAVRVLVVLYDIRVLVVRTPVSSLSFQVQQYLEHGTCKHPTDYKLEVWRSVSRVKTPCEQGLPHYTCYKQSNAFLMRRKGRRSAVSPWNVDLLLRSTTLRRIRSERSGLGQRSFRSSALNQKSCHASVAVMLEKRGGCCRTDGPIRVLSCQMRHTIAAIKARGVALCVEAPLRVRAFDSASCEKFTTACSKR